MVHFKASSLIETLVASAVFLTVFLLTLEATGRLGAIVAEEAEVQFAFEVVTVGLWHLTQTACLKSGRLVRYEYWMEYE